MNCLSYPFDSNFLMQKKKAIKRELLASGIAFVEKKIAILSGATIGNIADILELFLLSYGIKPVFHIGQYNRFYEDAVFDNHELIEFAPELAIIHTTGRNLADSATMEKLRAVWAKIEETCSCPIIQNNFELPLYGFENDVCDTDSLNAQISEHADKSKGFYVCDIRHLSARFGLEKWHNDQDYYLYKYAFSISAIPLYCHQLAIIIKSIYGKNQKCLVLDLDNTLWSGVVGDVGASNIELGPETALGEAYVSFQKYVKTLHERGIMLAVCSKNDEHTAREAFGNPNMVLSIDDFAVFCANWGSKAENIFAIARKMNILPESLVFVDDNPAERELVRQALPEVNIVEADDVVDFIDCIERAGYFYATSVSADDLKRNEYYAADKKRDEAKAAFHDYGKYLDSLEMSSEIRPFAQEHLERITQLINKTNQFNLTTKRYTLSEIEQIAQDDRFIALYATLDDKYGSNGIVSVIIGEVAGKSLHIRLWVMSCRVFKRDLELAVFDALVDECLKRGLDKIIGYYYKTAKNGFVSSLYDELGFERISDEKWELCVDSKYQVKNKYIEVREAI